MGRAGLTLARLLLLQFTGTWYTKALVSNRTLAEARKFKVAFPLVVTAREDGSLEARVTLM